MENSIKLSILLPVIPFGMSVFIFILLRLFNITINRLTKPVSFLQIISILISTLLGLYFLVNHVEGDVALPAFLSVLNNLNLRIHLNELTEKIIISLGVISSLIILISVSKLPRQNGYVLYIVNLGFFTSILIFGILLLEFPL